VNSLWESPGLSGTPAAATLHARAGNIPLSRLRGHSTLGAARDALQGRAVLVATEQQLPTALALIELDGIARRIVLCTPDLTAAQLAEVAATAEAEAIVLEAGSTIASPPGLLPCRLLPHPEPAARPTGPAQRAPLTSDWVLLTSGTTGTPKLVSHSFLSLSGTLPRALPDGAAVVWSTFYDIRRYGGLQIFLRALVAGTDLVLSDAGESVAEFLGRAAAAGVTHISGTPSHWRRALMSGEAQRIQPRYVRLSGEIADQPILDNLRRTYPEARISHAFASTEAGVAFDVDDGLAGFPASLIGGMRGGVEMRVVDGTLRIRSARNANRYLGAEAAALTADDGFVDTGDLVELVGERYHFRGRRGGVINVGGLKVHPEEVEAVLNADPRVRVSLVRARRNPITGAVVVADIVLAAPELIDADPTLSDRVRSDLIGHCRQVLAAHKVPTQVRIVPALDMTAAGKLVRPNA
jgi:acyl-CoA synthetase (AMP-forming)/AMP-acid ligase II